MPTPVQVLTCQNLNISHNCNWWKRALNCKLINLVLENYVCAEHFSSENFHFQVICFNLEYSILVLYFRCQHICIYPFSYFILLMSLFCASLISFQLFDMIYFKTRSVDRQMFQLRFSPMQSFLKP